MQAGLVKAIDFGNLLYQVHGRERRHADAAMLAPPLCN
jgi:hypothetical protein